MWRYSRTSPSSAQLSAHGFRIGRLAEVREPPAPPIIEKAEPARKFKITSIATKWGGYGSCENVRVAEARAFEPDAVFVRRRALG